MSYDLKLKDQPAEGSSNDGRTVSQGGPEDGAASEEARVKNRPVLPRPEIEDSLIGHLRSETSGPTVLIQGSLHGNEVSGALALNRVLPELEREGISKGELFALVGNPAAFAKRQRFVDRDLNRNWDAERIAALANGTAQPASVEDVEMMTLVKHFDRAFETARERCYILDIHSTSGASLPFLNVGDSLPSRWFARSIPVPVVLGLDEALVGTLLQYVEERGFIGVVFEGGQHEAATSIDHAEAAIWLALDNLGMLPEALKDRVGQSRALLSRVTHGEHRMFDVVYRHHLDDPAAYTTLPGFESFQFIREGRVMATQNDQKVVAPRSGVLLMPLYQAQGDDGFFLMTVCSKTQQRISRAVRRARLDRLLPLFPGVERAQEGPRRLWVAQRWLTGWRGSLLKLMSYRTVLDRRGDRVLLKRRRQRA